MGFNSAFEGLTSFKGEHLHMNMSKAYMVVDTSFALTVGNNDICMQWKIKACHI